MTPAPTNRPTDVAKANAVARQYHNPSIDVRKLFPDLFKARSTGRTWE